MRMAASMARGPPAAMALGVAAAPLVRIKLIFVEEIAPYVLRQRGFCSCWYMVPRSARLVGDLMHEVLEEFDLAGRCVGGIELLLDGIHVLANQDIGLIRDNDTLAVRCVAAFESQETPRKSTGKRPSMEADSGKERKKHKANAAMSKKPNIAMKSVVKAASSKEKATTKVPSVTKTASAAKRAASSSSSDSSSDSSSESSSESSDDEVRPTVKSAPMNKAAFKAVVKETVQEMQSAVKVRSNSSASESSDSSSSESEDEQTAGVVKPKRATKATEAEAGTKRTRRRRRLRRRAKADTEDKTAGTGSASNKDKRATTPPKADTPLMPPAQRMQPPQQQRPLRIRGAPPATKPKGHVRFDGSGQQDQLQAETQVAADLQKYGPQSHSSSRTTRDNPAVDDPGTRSKKTTTHQDKWKRPYEVVSSIFDGASIAASSTKPTLESLINQYPVKPTSESTSPSIQAQDVIAYKTLTLCLETWQPVLSEWKCGRVLTVDSAADNSLEIQPGEWKLPASSGATLAYEFQDQAEVERITLGEISELRYVEGPSITSS